MVAEELLEWVVLIGVKCFVSLEVGRKSIVQSDQKFLRYELYRNIQGLRKYLFSCLLEHDAIFAFALCRLVRTCPSKVFRI